MNAVAFKYICLFRSLSVLVLTIWFGSRWQMDQIELYVNHLCKNNLQSKKGVTKIGINQLGLINETVKNGFSIGNHFLWQHCTHFEEFDSKLKLTYTKRVVSERAQ